MGPETILTKMVGTRTKTTIMIGMRITTGRTEERTFKMATDKTAGPRNQAMLKSFFYMYFYFPKIIPQYLNCKKRLAVFTSLPGCHLPNSPWPGKIKLFPTRESLVSNIPAGVGKTLNLFLQCTGW
jgi:hypothetical protein